ncbi:MAG: TlpA family protein disulfide reductase [Prevotellaceae bacterium]|nr:TlpA family protein disulfide reductase [Prevotellaceae bacterium]
MKTPLWSAMLLLPVMMACNNFNNRGVIENPQVLGTNTTSIEVGLIELTDTATVLHIDAAYRPHNWIRIASGSFLRDNTGGKYAIRAGDGIELDKEFWMPDSGRATFNLIFQPIPATATSVDFSEGDDVEGGFEIWGIQLTDQPITVNLPQWFKEAEADPAAPLPVVEPKVGKARLEGQILNYTPAMGKNVGYWVYYPFTTGVELVETPVDKDGRFAAEIDAVSQHPVVVSMFGDEYRCFIAPGETTTVLLNPAEIARRNSRLRNSDTPIGEPAYYGGYLGALSKEIGAIGREQIASIFYGHMNTIAESERMSFLHAIKDKDVNGVKARLLDDYRAQESAIDATSHSAALKQLMHIANNLHYADDIFMIHTWMFRALIINNNLKTREEQQEASDKIGTLMLPSNYYDDLKTFPLLNTWQRVYLPTPSAFTGTKEIFAHALGTDRGPLFELLAVSEDLQRISDFEVLDAAQLAQVPQPYAAYVAQKNDELKATLERNKQKSGFNVNEDLGKELSGEDVLPFIIAKFKGKPMLIDFWATWCGPCKQANKMLKPVKEELKDKGIVYVYVAGEDSPLGTWNAMITDLPGEHFRLTDKQWKAARKALGIEGVPTYFYIDKEGNIAKKQTGFGSVVPMKEQLLKIAE